MERRIFRRQRSKEMETDGTEGGQWVPGRVEMAVQANDDRANEWKPIFALGSNHTCARCYWCTCFRLNGRKQSGSVKSPKGDRTQTFRDYQCQMLTYRRCRKGELDPGANPEDDGDL